MKTSDTFPEFLDEKRPNIKVLTDEELLELHIQDELQEMEEFFSKDFDEMELRFQKEEQEKNY